MVCASPPLRAHLRALLNREPALCFAGEADTAAEALDLFFRFRPDAVLVDVSLPNGNGFKIVECMKRAIPSCRVIMLSRAADPCVEEVSRMVGANHVCPTACEINPVLTLLRELADARGDGLVISS